ncbi:MAG: rhomboid family intramembrane serine protease [Gammaproteobacteria bacterium]|nr:rhomboid family intramembrane serine protease [Gammaproteobacteria bacterium]
MLIIPVEQPLDSHRPPLITLALVLTCLLVFMACFLHDTALSQKIQTSYAENKLFAYERDVYVDYLQDNQRPELDAITQETNLDMQTIMLQQLAAQDKAFGEYLVDQYFWKQYTPEAWKNARIPFNRLHGDYSVLRYGFVPAQANVTRAFTALYVHADWGHVFFNMVFLFIFGFSLEVALGRWWYLGLYHVTGLAGWLVTWAVASSSLVPHVGASGAVFGLLGMYLGLYGLRPIKFFFTLGFYNQYFKAPAALMLLYWGGYELYQYFTSADHVARFAHLGGLLTGFLLVFAARRMQWLKVDEAYVEHQEPDKEYHQALDRIYRAMEHLDFEKARHELRAVFRTKPNDFRLLRLGFDLYKNEPNSDTLGKIAQKLFSFKTTHPDDVDMLLRARMDYERIVGKPIDDTADFQLINVLIKQGRVEDAAILVKRYETEARYADKLGSIFLRMGQACLANRDTVQAKLYLKRVTNDFSKSLSAEQAAALLRSLN